MTQERIDNVLGVRREASRKRLPHYRPGARYVRYRPDIRRVLRQAAH